jgi:hypothetical protein
MFTDYYPDMLSRLPARAATRLRALLSIESPQERELRIASNRRAASLTWLWSVALVIAAAVTQRLLDLVAPAWVGWVGFVVSIQVFLILFAVAKTPRGGD